MKTRVRTFSNDNQGKPEGLKCPMCGELFNTSQEYAEHVMTHPKDEGDIITEQAQQRSGHKQFEQDGDANG